jgi:hypothetical protein
MNVIGLSDYYEGNLRKLAAYLRGPLRTKFDMMLFADELHDMHDRIATECGTAGCAIGHSPHAGVAKLVGESWESYSRRVFGLDFYTREKQWEWCFELDWAKLDNTPVGAAERIEWLLDGREVMPIGPDAVRAYRGYKSPEHKNVVPFKVIVTVPKAWLQEAEA